MAIFAVTKGEVRFAGLGFFNLTAERIQGCEEVKPGSYSLAHGYINLAVEISPNDAVSIAPDSVGDANATGKNFEFGGSSLLQLLRRGADKLSIIPKFGETALKVGPDDNGITLSLERYANENVAPVAIGTLAIESALRPKAKASQATSGGGRGSG